MDNYLLVKILMLPGVIIAITFHEFAHAYAADKLGDYTPRSQGRLNLNPLTHIDPIGFILLLLAGFGWGKPVQINPRNFDNKVSLRTGEAIVSFAGPLMNFILAIIFMILTVAIQFFAPDTTLFNVLYSICSFSCVINIGLGIFNLIPLPPLDGSKILKNFLPYNAVNWFENNERIFYIIFLVIWITGISSFILTPIFNAVYSGLNWLVLNIFELFL